MRSSNVMRFSSSYPAGGASMPFAQTLALLRDRAPCCASTIALQIRARTGVIAASAVGNVVPSPNTSSSTAGAIQNAVARAAFQQVLHAELVLVHHQRVIGHRDAHVVELVA